MRADADESGTVASPIRVDGPRRRGAGSTRRSGRIRCSGYRRRSRRRAAGGGPPGGGFRPGWVLPQMFQSQLNLSAEQKAKIEALRKDVDAAAGEDPTTTRGGSGRRCAAEAPAVRADVGDRVDPAAAVREAPEVGAAARPVAPSEVVQPAVRSRFSSDSVASARRCLPAGDSDRRSPGARGPPPQAAQAAR